MASGSQGLDADPHVLWEDQKKINQFAQQNARLDDISEEIKLKEQKLQNLEDAEAEIMIFDSDAKIPYQLGEIFVDLTVEEVLKIIENSKEAIAKEIAGEREKQEEIKNTMAELKIHLYGKFGDSINLEAD